MWTPARRSSSVAAMKALRLLCVVLAVGLAAAPAALASAGPTVPVVRCATMLGIKHHLSWPSSVAVLHSPASVRGLVAYSNSQLVLIGPAGMDCSGVIAVDGGSDLFVWQKGGRRPGQATHEAALTLMIDTACIGCEASDSCPFFTAFAKKLGFPCTSGVPAGEQVDRASSDLVLFEDPPGLYGSGWPSGGSDPANGLVGIQTSGRNSSVYRSTCTLPQSQHAVCTVSLNDVISRYG
jgi:hypothetical protein